MRYTKY